MKIFKYNKFLLDITELANEKITLEKIDYLLSQKLLRIFLILIFLKRMK